jgi:hypothetical protein
MEVSAYWTPQHLDVTDAPVRYAGPKATWIDEFERLRPFVRTDADDRMARRRVQTRAVVDSAEIMPLPPVAAPAPPHAGPRAVEWYRAVLRGGRAAT